MNSIKFNSDFLTDFNRSSKREYLETNTLGAYSSSTLAGANTRKYHGTFVVPQPQIDHHSYVLLNCLQEVAYIGKTPFELGVHQHPLIVHPRGFEYLSSFSLHKISTFVYDIGGKKIQKEIQFVPNKNQLLIRYSLLEGDKLGLRIKPFSSFRRIHKLRSASYRNITVNELDNGVSYCMEAGFDTLFIQSSVDTDFVANGYWHSKVEYLEELNRGYDFQEDLYSVGLLLFDLKKGEPVTISISTEEENLDKINSNFNELTKAKQVLNSLEVYLERAADQFMSKTSDNGVDICAGLHWFGRWGRDTFLSLPGLTLYRETPNPEVCKNVLKTMLKDIKHGLFTNTGAGSSARYNSADASLWFFWALQEYVDATDSAEKTWNDFKKEINHILDNYKEGTLYNIHMKENGLLYGGQDDVALTWMDAKVDGYPVTPRAGYTVELNALWYHSILFSLEMAEAAGDIEFIDKWNKVPSLLKVSFKDMFWSEEKGYLADACTDETKDWSFRPNQVFATSLKYSVCDKKMSQSILKKVKEKLLTPRGLRTLSQDDEKYIGFYNGNQKKRDYSYHQGIVWPWLLGHFAKGYIKVFGKDGLPLLELIYSGFENELQNYGVGSIAEIYEGEAPYKAKGTISQAWSVSELIRLKAIIKQLNNTSN
jgi:predicted glycogen debranching enzyme